MVHGYILKPSEFQRNLSNSHANKLFQQFGGPKGDAFNRLDPRHQLVLLMRGKDLDPSCLTTDKTATLQRLKVATHGATVYICDGLHRIEAARKFLDSPVEEQGKLVAKLNGPSRWDPATLAQMKEKNEELSRILEKAYWWGAQIYDLGMWAIFTVLH